MTDRSDIAAVADWLVEQGVLRPKFETLIEEYCQRLVAVGLPIWHAYFTSLTLHPTTATIGCLWHRNSGVERRSYTHEDARLGGWEKYPLHFMFKNRVSILRRRLMGPDGALDFPQLEELKRHGATDYVGQLTEFGLDGVPDRETGFLASGAIDALIVPAVALLAAPSTRTALFALGRVRGVGPFRFVVFKHGPPLVVQKAAPRDRPNVGLGR